MVTLGGLALAGAAPDPAPAYAAPAVDRVTVHADRVVGALPKFWRSTGFTPAELLLLPEMRQTLTFLGAIPNRGVEFVRVHYLLNLVTGARSRAGIAYDWSLLDEALDVLIHRGLRPVFELMGNPSDLFDDFENLDQLRAWRDLVAGARGPLRPPLRAGRGPRLALRDLERARPALLALGRARPPQPFRRLPRRARRGRPGPQARRPRDGADAVPDCSRRFSPIATGARARSPASPPAGSTSSPSTRRAPPPTTRTSPRGRSP